MNLDVHQGISVKGDQGHWGTGRNGSTGNPEYRDRVPLLHHTTKKRYNHERNLYRSLYN